MEIPTYDEAVASFLARFPSQTVEDFAETKISMMEIARETARQGLPQPPMVEEDGMDEAWAVFLLHVWDVAWRVGTEERISASLSKALGF